MNVFEHYSFGGYMMSFINKVKVSDMRLNEDVRRSSLDKART